MEKPEFTIEDDALYKITEVSAEGNYRVHRKELVIDKETFIKLYEAWIAPIPKNPYTYFAK
jgi:hypothetical protein